MKWLDAISGTVWPWAGRLDEAGARRMLGDLPDGPYRDYLATVVDEVFPGS